MKSTNMKSLFALAIASMFGRATEIKDGMAIGEAAKNPNNIGKDKLAKNAIAFLSVDAFLGQVTRVKDAAIRMAMAKGIADGSINPFELAKTEPSWRKAVMGYIDDVVKVDIVDQIQNGDIFASLKGNEPFALQNFYDRAQAIALKRGVNHNDIAIDDVDGDVVARAKNLLKESAGNYAALSMRYPEAHAAYYKD